MPLGDRHILLDTIPVDPASISFSQVINYTYDEESRELTWEQATDSIESLEVCYKVLSPALLKSFFLRDISYYDPSDTRPKVNFNPLTREINNELFASPRLSKSGSITRGISVGNRQNAFVNSSLNLALDGYLTDDLKVSALITDQNIPYQPEGNTQQLRDFDNVFIRLYNDAFDLNVGDIVLTNPETESYFLKYYKNVQGAAVSYKGNLGKQWATASKIAASAAKGQFASIVIDPIEGVQGPYRVRGPEGQRFIIVLANSERVFVDGKKLERGFDRDYVIDYNLGEIIFNTNVIITRFTRIRVDFEFLEQSYGRSNLAIHQAVSDRNHRIYFSFYRERDNINSTPNLDLDDAGRLALSELGDAPNGAFVSGADSIGFIEERVLYSKVDTLVDDSSEQIFVFSTNPEVARYQVRFTEVGMGNGNYVLTQSTSNGRVYRWVAPEQGVPQGNFEPVIQLNAPDQRQMLTVGSSSALGRVKISQELALSNRDLNLLSSMDDDDNQGVAWNGKVQVDSLITIGPYFGSIATGFEFNQATFQAIDRFRYIEFDRDWSYQTDSSQTHQYITSFGWSLRRDRSHFHDYTFQSRQRGTFSGTRHKFKTAEKLGAIHFNGDYFLLNSKQLTTSSRWFRANSTIRLENNLIVPGYKLQSDENTIKTLDSDSIIGTNMYFRENMFFVENPDSSVVSYRISYSRRNDELPVDGRLQRFTEAQNYQLLLSSRLSRQQFQVDFNYRDVKDVINRERTDLVQGRLLSINSMLDGHVRSNLSLAISSGRELRKEFVYILVNTGEGTHTWRDENGDGIQDLNEFYEAVNPDEKTYIKLFVPTDEYIDAFRNLYVHTLDVSMPRGWKQREGLLKLLSRISYQVNFNLDTKTSDASFKKRINPYASLTADENVISLRNKRRYSVFFNRASPGFGSELSINQNERRQLLTNGFEQLEERNFSQSTRVSFFGEYTLRAGARIGTISNRSDFLVTRNFEIATKEISPEVNWQPSTSFRLSLGYKFSDRRTPEQEDPDKSSTREWSLEATGSKLAKGNINGRFTYANINFEGEEDSFLGYTLLNALRPGRNYLLNLNWQQKLANGLQLTLQYFGRKSGQQAFIHTGNFQLTAFF